jgi:translation initiation factor IF-2
MKAAKEFNVGKQTIVEFLQKVGFTVDNKPDPVLSGEMYDSLIREYDAERAAKMKSEKVVLNKQAEEKKIEEAKKAAEEAKAKAKAEVVKQETPEIEGPKILGKIDLEEKSKKKAAPKKEAVEPTPEIKEVVQEEVIVPPVEAKEEVKTPPPVEEDKSKKKTVRPTERLKIEAPEIDGPKVLGKIDLNKKPEPAPVKTEPPVAETTPPPTEAVTPAKEEVVLHSFKREILSGPKVLGKIVLPVQQTSDNKPKKKRKRIPLDGKGPDNRPAGTTGPNTRPDGGGGGYNRGPGGGGYNRGPGGGSGIDAKEIQDKIKETQAKLAGGGGRGKSLKAKYRREKRQEAADAAEGMSMDDNKLQVTEFVTVSELANLMDVSFSDVIGKCMSLGFMVSINQRLDAEVIELVASEFGFEVEFIDL